MTHAIRTRIAAVASATVMALLLGACASKGPTTAQYDFGPLPTVTQAAPQAINPAAIIVTDVSGPAALDSERMYYRLLYADARQSRPYAYNQWTSTPPQLLTQRMKAHIAQAGVKVLTPSDAAASTNLLRMEVEDFTQNFDTATSSSGTLRLRASVFRSHQLVDQKTFSRSAAAPSADAAGGARALADAADAVAADLLAWLAALPPSKE
jgi:cholesterol transport system auxiliary component